MSQILIFGDSITYGFWDKQGGWVNRIRMWIDTKNMEWSGFYFRIYNLGIDGNTTDDLLFRFDKEVISRIEEQTKTIIIFAIGINDSQFINKSKKLRIPQNKFENNLKKLISLSTKYSKTIIFIGPNPIDEKKVDPMPWAKDRSYKNEYIKKYGEIIKKVCFEKNIYYIEIFDEWMKFDYKKLLEDGAHPNSEGHKKIFETVKNFLIPKDFHKLL